MILIYTKIKHNGHSYDVRDLERALIIPKRQQAVIHKWTELADQKCTIAFCCSQEHAVRTATKFRAAGITSASYVATTSADERRELLQKLANGELKVLCAVDVLNEGADIPFVECLLFLRPTESKRIFYQQLGRGLRMYAGKTHCTVIDFIGNFKNAYKIVEYNSLVPNEREESVPNLRSARSWKDILDLPLNCTVRFDQRIIDIFSSQALDPRNATRHNIGRILLYEFEKLERHLRRRPTYRDADRFSYFDSSFYVQVFGSWMKFESIYSGFKNAEDRNKAG
jgi:superfamily II DNA or RNA helicase